MDAELEKKIIEDFSLMIKRIQRVMRIAFYTTLYLSVVFVLNVFINPWISVSLTPLIAACVTFMTTFSSINPFKWWFLWSGPVIVLLNDFVGTAEPQKPDCIKWLIETYSPRHFQFVGPKSIRYVATCIKFRKTSVAVAFRLMCD
jgi:hypothetical protein